MTPHKIILQTQRLLLREFTTEDYSFIFDLNNDPEVIKYTGDRAFESSAAAKNFIEQYDQYERFGMGRWIAILRDTGELTGWCGLKFMPELNEVDLGYRFMRKFWGMGLATEAALACVKYGFDRLRLKRIIGRVMTGNPASIKVLEKCGLHFVKDMQFDEHPGMLFEIENPDWKQRDYKPIDCNFYDQLEAYATVGKQHEIAYRNDIGIRLTKAASIKDLFTQNKEEFMVLDDGTTFRLDQLISIDGKTPKV